MLPELSDAVGRRRDFTWLSGSLAVLLNSKNSVEVQVSGLGLDTGDDCREADGPVGDFNPSLASSPHNQPVAQKKESQTGDIGKRKDTETARGPAQE